MLEPGDLAEKARPPGCALVIVHKAANLQAGVPRDSVVRDAQGPVIKPDQRDPAERRKHIQAARLIAKRGLQLGPLVGFPAIGRGIVHKQPPEDIPGKGQQRRRASDPIRGAEQERLVGLVQAAIRPGGAHKVVAQEFRDGGRQHCHGIRPPLPDRVRAAGFAKGLKCFFNGHVHAAHP